MAVLAAALVALPAPAAQAGLSTPIPADEIGDPQDFFTDSNGLFAYVLSDIKGGEVCVVGMNATESNSCGAAAWGGKNSVVGIGTQYVPIAAPPLTPGTWRLLSTDSEGNNGKLSEPFTVVECDATVMTCDSTIAAEVFAEWKAAANQNLIGAAGVCLTFAAKDLASASKTWRGRIGKAGSLAENYTDSTGFLAIAGGAVGGALGFVGLFSVGNPGEEKALEILKDLSCALTSMYSDIAADPPAFDYTTVAPAELSVIPDLPTTSQDSLVATLDRQRAQGMAARIAIERWQGAMADASSQYIALQGNAAAAASRAQVAAIYDSADALRAYAGEIATDPRYDGPVAVTQADKDDIVAVYDRVRTLGLSQSEKSDLAGLGYSLEQISGIEADFAATDATALPVGVSLPAAVTSLATTLEASAAAFDRMARAAETSARRANQPPTATASASPSTGAVPLAVSFTGIGADPDGQITAYAWDFGDGSTGTGPTPTHTYTAVGTFTATLTVTDNGGRKATATTAVTVDPSSGPPVLRLEPGPWTTTTAATLQVSMSPYDPDGGAIVATSWDFGDGATTDAGSVTTSVSHAYALPGTYTVTVSATDAGGETTTETRQVAVTGVDPVVLLHGPQVAVVGDPVPFSVSGYGAAPGSVLALDYGDGSPVETSTISDWQWSLPAPTHTFATAGERTVTATLTTTDGRTGTATDAVSARVLTAVAGPDRSAPEGTPITFDGTGSAEVPATILWDFGDGTPAANSLTPEHTYADNGSYTVTLTINTLYQSQSDEVTVTVSNADPVVDAIAAGPAAPGEPMSLRTFAHDPGTADTLTYAWDFGDGSTGAGAVTTHTFADAGTRTVSVLVTDDDGGSETRTQQVVVAAAPAGPVDSRGRDFWTALPCNYQAGGTARLAVYVAAEAATTARVQVPVLGFDQPATVAAGGVAEVELPTETPVCAPQSSVADHGIHVTSQGDVSVYLLSWRNFTTDATLVLPTDALVGGTRVLAWTDPLPSQATIVATRNGTHVTVTPTGDVAGIGAEPFTRTLDIGDALYLTGGAAAPGSGLQSADLTGSRIDADAPVAVSGGTQCAYVPNDASACDHLLEISPPSSTWGTAFLTHPLALRQGGDLFRVLARDDGTEVRVDGVLAATLAGGGHYDTLITSPARITTSKPALVGQFSRGGSTDGVPADPFLAMVPPAEQFLSSYSVASPSFGTPLGTPDPFARHFVNVVIPTTAVASLQIDGAAADPAAFTPIGGSGYSGAALEVPVGAHRLTASRPFGLLMYGFSDWDSYGYIGGLNLARVADVASVSVDPAAQQVAAGAQACVTIAAKDAAGSGVPGVRLDVALTGAATEQLELFADADGSAPLCRTRPTAGVVTVTASVGALTDSATITWGALPPGNRAPVAVADSLTAVAGAATPVAVLANDTDADGDVLSVTSPAPTAAHGTVSCTGAGTCTYTSALAYVGSDSFSYTASDGHGGTAVGAVTVTVVPKARALVVVKPTRLVISGKAAAVATCSMSRGLTRSCDVTVKAPNGTVLARGSARSAAGAASLPVKLTLTTAAFKPAAYRGGVDTRVVATVSGPAGSGTATAALALRPVQQKLVILGETLFPKGSATLSGAAVKRLKAAAVKVAGAKLVTCAGFTDNLGSAASGIRLGMARAKAVCAIVGRRAQKVRTISYGEARPVASNATEAGRRLNRRVEVTIRF